MATVVDAGYKVSRVGRPHSPHAATLAVAQGVGVEGAVWYAVAKILHAVGGELNFNYGAVLFVFLGFEVIVVAHAVEVEVLGINHGFFVGRHACPVHLLVFVLFVLEVSEALGVEVPFEEEYFFACFRLLFGFFVFFAFFLFRLFVVLRRPHLKSECVTVVLSLEFFDGQVTGFERVFHYGGELRSQFVAVPQRSFLASDRVHHIPEIAIAGFILIPKHASVFHPMRC